VGSPRTSEVFEQVIPKVEAAIIAATEGGITDEHQLQQVIRRTVGGWVGGKIRRRPMIIPIVIEALSARRTDPGGSSAGDSARGLGRHVNR
jgi:ribonuclease J